MMAVPTPQYRAIPLGRAEDFDLAAARMEGGCCPLCGTKNVEHIAFEGETWLWCHECPPGEGMDKISLHRLRPAKSEHEREFLGPLVITTRFLEGFKDAGAVFKLQGPHDYERAREGFNRA